MSAFNEQLNRRLLEASLFNRYSFNVMAGFGLKDIQGNNKFGQVLGLDILDGRVPVWEEGTAYPYPTAPIQPSFASDDADDTELGAGARTIEVQGNDAEGYFQIETVTLQGLTPVLSTKTWSRIYRMKVLTAGATRSGEGQIYCGENFTLGIPTTVYARINDGNNQTQMCIFTVPKGFYCAITSITYTTISGKPIIYQDEARFNRTVFDEESVFLNTRTINVSTDYSLSLQPNGIFPELTDLRITAQATQNQSNCESAFRFILIPKLLIDELQGI